MNRIGVDVGGTNTDAVLLHGTDIVASVKMPTTADVTRGIVAALADIVRQSGVDRGSIDAIMIGTTHFTNAVHQGVHLTPVAASADPETLETVEIEDMPLAYMPGNSVRIRVRVVGDIAPT